MRSRGLTTEASTSKAPQSTRSSEHPHGPIWLLEMCTKLWTAVNTDAPLPMQWAGLPLTSRYKLKVRLLGVLVFYKIWNLINLTFYCAKLKDRNRKNNTILLWCIFKFVFNNCFKETTLFLSFTTYNSTWNMLTCLEKFKARRRGTIRLKLSNILTWNKTENYTKQWTFQIIKVHVWLHFLLFIRAPNATKRNFGQCDVHRPEEKWGGPGVAGGEQRGKRSDRLHSGARLGVRATWKEGQRQRFRGGGSGEDRPTGLVSQHRPGGGGQESHRRETDTDCFLPVSDHGCQPPHCRTRICSKDSRYSE